VDEDVVERWVGRWGGWRTNSLLHLAFQAREGAEDCIFDATRRVLPSLLC